MRDFLIAWIVAIILMLLITYTCSSNKDKTVIGNTLKEDSLMKSMVGEKILYEKDSLTIVDYSFWNDTYTLSNGIKVHKKLVK